MRHKVSSRPDSPSIVSVLLNATAKCKNNTSHASSGKLHLQITNIHLLSNILLSECLKIRTHTCTLTKTQKCLIYIRGPVHRNSSLKKYNEMQQYADIYLLLNYCTCFGRPSHPSSGVHKTVVAASGTDHTVWGASFLK